MYIMEWEWDDAKNAANTAKHGVCFEGHCKCLLIPLALKKKISPTLR